MIARALVLLLLVAAPACLAGETYLDRSKVRDAVPYGTSIEPAAPQRKAAPPAGLDRDAGQPSGMTPSTLVPEAIEHDRGRGSDRR
jgi:hypothetical protein